jgi:glycosyltransferase involved in cell wall biosynthesis
MILSIITVNLNNSIGLKDTTESVLNQSFKDYEYIVIDGGSNDGSREVINRYSDSISYWVSETDTGIYNAMNKGLEKAKGEYLLMLNSGDVLFNDNILENVIEAGLDKDIVYGDVYEITRDGNGYIKKFPDQLMFSFFYKYSLGHQASFIKKNLHETVGFYLETNRIVSDWSFLTLAIIKYNCSYKHIPITVATCKRDGISCDPDYWSEILKERDAFLEQTFPFYLSDYIAMDHLREDFEKLNQKYQKEMNSGIFKKIKRRVFNFYHGGA